MICVKMIDKVCVTPHVPLPQDSVLKVYVYLWVHTASPRGVDVSQFWMPWRSRECQQNLSGKFAFSRCRERWCFLDR